MTCKEIRSKIGATQKQLALFLGVSLKTVQHWELENIVPVARRSLLCILEENSKKVIIKNNMIVFGGDLWLDGLQSIPEGFNPTVGGSLWLDGLQSNFKRFIVGYNSEKQYIYADGILRHVARIKIVGEYTWYIGKIKGKDVVFDGENYAHCKNLKQGIADLFFKKAKNRGTEQYEIYNMDSVLKYQEMVAMYRIITGACSQGIEDFVSKLPEVKEMYTVSEVVNMTYKHYGHDVFKKFFQK